ncbi:MAG TPA: YkgJ family cysteine cluster protein [Dongiaceae bacterium]|nr:YkgJ family cysteine cluster protein [Dongiaceae bacterium]
MADCFPEDPDWDSRCLQCGRCCFEKIEDERGTIFYTQTACRFLDVSSRECKIFERRFEINPDCVKLTPDLVKTLRWLPRDCGYRKPDIEPVAVSRKIPK